MSDSPTELDTASLQELIEEVMKRTDQMVMAYVPVGQTCPLLSYCGQQPYMLLGLLEISRDRIKNWTDEETTG